MKYLLHTIALICLLASCTPKGGKVLKKEETTSIPPKVQVDTLVVVEEEVIPEEIPPYLVAVLKKTACYGKCPVYEAKIFSDGHLVYVGEKGVERIGKYEAWHGQQQLEQIKATARSMGYFDLQEVYPPNERTMEDLPMTITYLNFDNQEKSIINNYDSPKRLRDFEQFLETLFDAVQWRPILNNQ